MVDGASYLERVVGDEVSSREARRVSEAAESLKIPVRVDEATGSGALVVAAGLTGVGAGFTFDSSSVSDSSSELDSSSDDSDSSFLAAGAAGVDDCKNRL